MAALGADVVVRAKLVGQQSDAATGAVRREQDLRQLVALDRDVFLVTLEDGHQEPPISEIHDSFAA